MGLLKHILRQLLRIAAGAAVFTAAIALPVYFNGVDSSVLSRAGLNAPSPESAMQLYLDSAKPSVALFIAKSSGDYDNVETLVEAVFKERPKWRASGGNEPFFEAFHSTLGAQENIRYKNFYEILALGENRKKLLNFLNQTEAPIVKKILSLRSMNAATLPAVYTSAGAPLDAAILTTALLVQAGDVNQSMLRALAGVVDSAAIGKDTLEFEKFSLSLLTFTKELDWTQLRILVSAFNSPWTAYEFATTFRRAPSESARKALIASVYLGSRPEDAIAYLEDADEYRWLAFRAAVMHGMGSLEFLYAQDKPLYVPSAMMRALLPHLGFIAQDDGVADACVNWPGLILALKTALIFIAGYLFLRGFMNLFTVRRDTPSWHSPLALLRGFLEASIFAMLVLIFTEPDTLGLSFGGGNAPEMTFNVDKILNSAKKNTMQIELNLTTIVVTATFLLLQMVIYVIGLIRISSIKRSGLSAKVKLDVLGNEGELFDLGLYVGLWGTVLSLVLLSMGILSASFITAYTSTLFGILFTAMLKIVHVRSYRHKLIIEAANSDKI